MATIDNWEHHRDIVTPDSVVLLAGFVLAHAAWSVSDLPKGELLVPLAVVETGARPAPSLRGADARAIDRGRQGDADQASGTAGCMGALGPDEPDDPWT